MNESVTAEQTIISVPGIECPVTLFQITDMHLTCPDPEDCSGAEEPERIQTKTAERAKYFTLFPGRSTADVFEGLLEYAAERSADCVVMAGDIMDFQSPKIAGELERMLKGSGNQYLYVNGNHEHDEKRLWDRDLLKPFTDPSGCGALEVGGVRLIGVDNTGYKISPEQLTFLRERTADGKPCLLFMHIPLYVDTLEEDTVRRWGNPILLGLTEEAFSRQTPGMFFTPRPDGTTREFCRLAGETPNIYGVFAGHLHLSHTDRLPSGRFQYVTNSGYENSCREIRLLPESFL